MKKRIKDFTEKIIQPKNKKELLIAILIISVIIFSISLAYVFGYKNKQIQPYQMQPPQMLEQQGKKYESNTPIDGLMTVNDFIPLVAQSIPEFIDDIKTSDKLKLYFRYDSEDDKYNGFYKQYKEDIKNNNRYPVLSRLLYGSDYYQIFSTDEKYTDFTGGKNYSVEYVGLKTNNIDLIRDIKIDLSTFYFSGCSFNSPRITTFLINNTFACDPPRHIVPIGRYDMELYEKSGDIYWYKLKNPVMISDNNSIINIDYRANGKEGFLQLQLANVILKGIDGNYYQPTIRNDFSRYYKAYFK